MDQFLFRVAETRSRDETLFFFYLFDTVYIFSYTEVLLFHMVNEQQKEVLWFRANTSSHVFAGAPVQRQSLPA